MSNTTQLVKTRARHEVLPPWRDEGKGIYPYACGSDSGALRDAQRERPEPSCSASAVCPGSLPPGRSHPEADWRLHVFSDVASRGHQDYCTASTREWPPRALDSEPGALPAQGTDIAHSHTHTGCSRSGTPDRRATQAAHRDMLGWAREISRPSQNQAHP